MHQLEQKNCFIIGSNIFMLNAMPFLLLTDLSYRPVKYNVFCCYSCYRPIRGADKSLARPGRKQSTATEDFEFHISYLLSQLEEY